MDSYHCDYCSKDYCNIEALRSHYDEVFKRVRCRYPGCCKMDTRRNKILHHWTKKHTGPFEEPEYIRLKEPSCQTKKRHSDAVLSPFAVPCRSKYSSLVDISQSSDTNMSDSLESPTPETANNTTANLQPETSINTVTLEEIEDKSGNISDGAVGDNLLQCPACEKAFPTIYQRNEHIRETSIRCKCALCPYLTQRPHMLKKHVMDSHPDSADDFGKMGFKRVRLLRQSCSPLGGAELKQYVEVTDRKTAKQELMKSRVKPEGSEGDSSECNGIADSSDNSVVKLTGSKSLERSGYHIPTTADGLSCPDCGKTFRTRAQQVDHIRDTRLRLKCPLCTLLVERPNRFSKHFEEQHQGEPLQAYVRVRLITPSCVQQGGEKMFIAMEEFEQILDKSAGCEALTIGTAPKCYRRRKRKPSSEQRQRQPKLAKASSSQEDDVEDSLDQSEDSTTVLGQITTIEVAPRQETDCKSFETDIQELLHVPRNDDDSTIYKARWEAHRMSMAQYVSDDIMNLEATIAVKQKLLSAILKAQPPLTRDSTDRLHD